MLRYAVSTMILLFAISPVLAQPEIPRQFQDSIAYVKNLQTNIGGYLSMEPRENERLAPTLSATLAAVRAIKYFGGEIPKKELTQKFVASCYNPATGAFSDFARGEGDVLRTCLGLMAVVDLGMPVDEYKAATKYLEQNAKDFEEIRLTAAAFESLKIKPATAEAWIKQLRKEQNADGTFGKGDGAARDTGSAVVAILRLGGKIEHRDAVLKTLRDGQQPNGGFGKGETPFDAELATTYRVMRAFHMLDAVPKDVEGVRSFVEKCRNEDGGYSVSPGERSNVSATYYAAIIHYWLKKK